MCSILSYGNYYKATLLLPTDPIPSCEKWSISPIQGRRDSGAQGFRGFGGFGAFRGSENQAIMNIPNPYNFKMTYTVPKHFDHPVSKMRSI